MKLALLRVGIDTGSGGIHGPLYQDGSFEFIPIPDGFGLDEQTYGNTVGRHGLALSEYFPVAKRDKATSQSMHVDPEFETFTYGDPTSPKAGLRQLEPGDLLVFYCGLEGWDFRSDPALYLCGYFEVQSAGYATEYDDETLRVMFANNFHVRHSEVFDDQRNRLVLVKGSPNSRLLNQAVLISEYGRDSAGRPLKVLSEEMQQIFGDFDGKVSFQRSPTRWVDPQHVNGAAEFVMSLK
jgi:hypothetical protein